MAALAHLFGRGDDRLRLVARQQAEVAIHPRAGRLDGGEGEDEFRFVLSDEEFLDLFLEDLELPDLAKRQVLGVEETQPARAGYRSSGPPATLSVSRTMRNSLSRRAAPQRFLMHSWQAIPRCQVIQLFQGICATQKNPKQMPQTKTMPAV